MRKESARTIPALTSLVFALLLASGCGTVEPGREIVESEVPDEMSAALAAAEEQYADGEYGQALAECVDMTRIDPDNPALIDLRNRCIAALLEQRAMQVEQRGEDSTDLMAIEAHEKSFLPDTYGLRRFEKGSDEDFADGDSPLYKLLEKTVSIHLEDANVGQLIETLSGNEGVNMIADKGIASQQAINVDVDEVPLKEVLDFISRNYGIEFYLGRNIIWITKSNPKQAGPLETRIFTLNKGLQLHGSDWQPEKGKKSVSSDLGVISSKATVLSDGPLYMQQVIEKFVPKVEGAEFHIDMNSHTVLARNTPDNLRLIGKILDSLDQTPLQVLIEARFIEISQANLRELGLDWTLNSPFITSKEGVYENGAWTRQPKTQVDSGNLLSYTPYSSDDSGTFALGPQGAFGLVRDGNPPTAGQGLNLTYQGVLTEPMFQAVLHALEISGDGKTLSVPRVTTVNNNPAKLRDGDDLLYYQSFKAQAFSLVDSNNNRYTVTALIPDGEPDLAELGITLVAVPSVGADGKTISLLLAPAISSLDRFVSYQDETDDSLTTDNVQQVVVKLPVIKRREVQTKVIVESGETVVLGGLIRTVRQDTLHSVPILGSLPLIGKLFDRVDVTEENRNLLIFVTATVINERGESVLPARERVVPQRSDS